MSEKEPKPRTPALAPGETIGLLALAATLVALLWLAHRYLGGLSVRALSADGSVQQAMGQMRLVLFAAAFMVLASAVVLGRLLWRIGKATIAQKHFPPEGVVVVDTRTMREGPAALRAGELLCRLGIATGSIGAIAAVLAVLYALSL